MKRIAVLVAMILYAAGNALASSWSFGLVKTVQKLVFEIDVYDTVGIQRNTVKPDSFTVDVWAATPAGSGAAVYHARSGATTPAWIRRVWSDGDSSYVFVDSVADMDADSGNGLYTGSVRAWLQGRSAKTAFSFRLGSWDDGDSAVVDGSILGGLSNAITATTIAAAAITSSEAANLDAAVTSRMATYTQPTGFLAATFPTTVASPTNITAGTITTVTNDVGIKAVDTILHVTFVDGFAMGAITSNAFTAGAINAAAIAANAIDSTKIANGAVGPTEFSAETDIVSGGPITTSGGAVSTVTTTATVTNDVGVKSPDTVAVVLNVNNINSADTITTVLGNVNGSVASVTAKTGYSLTDAAYGVQADSMSKHSVNASLPDTTIGGSLRELHDSLNTQTWATTGGAASIDSLMIRRWVWDSTGGRYIQGGIVYKRAVDSSYVANIKAADTVSTVTTVTNDVGIKANDTVLYVRHVDTAIYSAVTGVANSVNIKPDDTVLYVRHVDSTLHASGVAASVSAADMGNIADSVAKHSVNASLPDTTLGGAIRELHDSLATQSWASTGSAGSGPQTLSVTVIDTSGTDAVVPAVYVSAQNIAQSAELWHNSTLSTGVATGNNQVSTAIAIAAYLPGYTFPVFKDTTGAGTTFADTVRGYNIAIDAPAAANVKRIYGYEYNGIDTLQGIQVLAVLVNPPATGDSVVVDTSTGVQYSAGMQIAPTSGWTNSSGYWYLDLPLNSNISPFGTRWDVTAKNSNGTIRWKVQINVINTATDCIGHATGQTDCP